CDSTTCAASASRATHRTHDVLNPQMTTRSSAILFGGVAAGIALTVATFLAEIALRAVDGYGFHLHLRTPVAPVAATPADAPPARPRPPTCVHAQGGGGRRGQTPPPGGCGGPGVPTPPGPRPIRPGPRPSPPIRCSTCASPRTKASGFRASTSGTRRTSGARC